MGEEAFVARIGGDEFAMILTSNRHQGTQLLEKLKNLIQAFQDPFRLSDAEVVIGLSIGVTSFSPEAPDVGAMMGKADIAMYAAKADGKNRIRLFTPDLQLGVDARHQVQSKLRRALHNGEISLCYQPKVCAATWKPIGCEALVRWRTSDGQFVSPSEFVPIAEQTGLILPLGELVFRLAAEQARVWHDQGLDPCIAVNVSPHQLRHAGFAERLVTMLETAQARPEWFELEITENAMMHNVDRAADVIEQLARIGFRVAIDDFGTGYSSLSYLKHFRIHTLKVDLSFVRDVTRDWQSEAVVRSIVSLGAGLGLNIVAEGVETSEQAMLLAEIGCTTLQGYRFGRPMSPEQYVHWLENC